MVLRFDLLSSKTIKLQVNYSAAAQVFFIESAADFRS
ncbi:MAG: hypothetical protein QOG23_2269 [Blastocatellia bacterium]|nr:hypothetical protein [Blastocatellia bacterium]